METRDDQGYLVLTPKFSKLYERTSYLNKKVDLVINSIIEYDIRSANTSSLRNAGALTERELSSIEELPRHDRQVAIGKMIKENPKVGKIIHDQITWAKSNLFRANGIQDEEILSIKNDAVYIIGRKLKSLKFGAMEFRPKSVYSAYMMLDGLEVYYDGKEKRVDIKGISDDILEIEDHQKGILSFMATCMGYIVRDRRDALTKYLIEYTSQYKKKELPVEHYRELSKYNAYRLSFPGDTMAFYLEQISEEDLKDVSGIYNFNRIILPMIQRFI